jgi:hypothetical protein
MTIYSGHGRAGRRREAFTFAAVVMELEKYDLSGI